jgi:hypothetical protein
MCTHQVTIIQSLLYCTVKLVQQHSECFMKNWRNLHAQEGYDIYFDIMFRWVELNIFCYFLKNVLPCRPRVETSKFFSHFSVIVSYTHVSIRYLPRHSMWETFLKIVSQPRPRPCFLPFCAKQPLILLPLFRAFLLCCLFCHVFCTIALF